MVQEVNVTNYENLCETTIGHILLLSRRRPAEAARAEIIHYESREKQDYVSPNIMSTLNEEERAALHTLSMFVVPGKNEQQVPILMTKEMKTNIDLIIACRKKLGIPDTNTLLFARPGLSTPFDGTKILNKLRDMCPGLHKPEFLTATGLRHHCATVSQVHGERFVGHLSKFMGHTSFIHKKSYQYPLAVIQKGVLGRSMLSMEGSNLQITTNNDNNNSCNDPLITENIVTNQVHNDQYFNQNDTVNQGLCKNRVKRRWTEKEKSLVFQHFMESIISKRNPSTRECDDFIEQQTLFKRSSAQIKTFVNNIITGKQKLPPQYEYLCN